MISRVVEVAEDGHYLSITRGFLKVSRGDETVGQVPMDDMACLMLSANQMTISKSILVALAERGIVTIICGKNYHPISCILPLFNHHDTAGTVHDQIATPKPLKKRLWQCIIRQKILNQAKCLKNRGLDNKPLLNFVKRVNSGDTQNMEAQAARTYWPLLMGKTFRRDQNGGGINARLNYGYAVLRASVARAVIAAGLQPALGIHHQNRLNPFQLVDDLMEPFRPLVDDHVASMENQTDDITPDEKRYLARVLHVDMQGERGQSPLVNCVERAAQTLAESFRTQKLACFLPNML